MRVRDPATAADPATLDIGVRRGRAVLAEGGARFTALRHGFYAERALHRIEHGLAAGEIRAPED